MPWDLYTIPGMALTEAVALAPIAYMFCANALRNSDASLEGAAQTVGAGPFRILRSVIIPMLRPPIVYSSVLVFSMSIETLSIPLLYGQPVDITVFATFLYKNGLQSIDPDYGILGAASVIILLVTVLLVAVQAKLLKDAKRFVSVRGKATRPRLLDLGWIKWLSVAFITVYVVIGALIPILGLVMRSFTKIFTPLQNPLISLTMANYQRIFEFPVYVASIRNSLIVAGVGAVLVSVLAVVAVVVAKRSTFRYRKVIEYLALAPQAMPGLIIGIGLFWAFAFLPVQHGRPAPGHHLGHHHRLRPARPAQRLRLHLPGGHADRRGTGQRRPRQRRGLDADVPPRPGQAPHPRVRRRHGPDLRGHDEGILPGDLPRLGRHQRHRHHHARALGPGQHRIGRRPGHHPDRHHRSLRRHRRPAHER